MRQGCRPSKRFAFGARPAQSGLRALDQEIAFEFGDSGNDLHRHPTGRTGEVHPTQGEAVNPDADRCQRIDGASNIHGIAAETVELGDDEYVTGFQSIDQAPERRSLHCRRAAGDGFGNNLARLDGEAGGFHLAYLVLGGLTDGGDTGVEESAGHGVVRSSETDAP